MKSSPSSEHGIAHPVKTWPSSLVSRFPHFLKTRFTRFPHFSGYRAALFRPRDCIKRRFRRFYRLTVARRPGRLAEWRSGLFRGALQQHRANALTLVTQVYGEPAVPIHGHNGPHGRSFAKCRRHMNIFLGNDCSALAIRFIQIPIYSGLPNAHHHRNLTDRTITRQRHGVSER